MHQYLLILTSQLGLADATALVYHETDDLVFFIDAEKKTVNRIPSTGGTHTTIIGDNLEKPTSLSVDWLSRKLYIADSGSHKIEAIDFSGRTRSTVYWSSEYAPLAVHVRPDLRRLFWASSTSGSRGRIDSASACGTSRRTLINRDVWRPHSLTSDLDKLYWFDGSRHRLHSCLLDGSRRHLVFSETGDNPFSLDHRDGSFYWIAGRSIISLRDSDLRHTVVRDGVDFPSGLTLPVVRRPHLANPCASAARCPHLCLLSSANKLGYSCLCDDDQTSSSSGGGGDGANAGLLVFRCSRASRKLLLVAAGWNILGVTLSEHANSSVHGVENLRELPIRNIKKAISVAYDYENSMVYWSDFPRGISRSRMDGSQRHLVVGESIESDGIAIAMSGLYWTDARRRIIETSDLDGANRIPLITSELRKPRSLVLHRGFMYWTDWGSKPRIELAFMDGTERKVLVDTSLTWPNGLAVHETKQHHRLYWCDSSLDVLESIRLDGGDRRVFLSSRLQKPFAFGLAILDHQLYATYQNLRVMLRFPLADDGSPPADDVTPAVVVEQVPDMMGVAGVDLSRSAGAPNPAHKTACNVCSHRCLLRGSVGVACACPLRLELGARGACVAYVGVSPRLLLVVGGQLRRYPDGRLLPVAVDGVGGLAYLADARHADARHADARHADAAQSARLGSVYWSTKSGLHSSSADGSRWRHVIVTPSSGVGGDGDIEAFAVDTLSRNIYAFTTDDARHARRLTVYSETGRNRRHLLTARGHVSRVRVAMRSLWWLRSVNGVPSPSSSSSSSSSSRYTSTDSAATTTTTTTTTTPTPTTTTTTTVILERCNLLGQNVQLLITFAFTSSSVTNPTVDFDVDPVTSTLWLLRGDKLLTYDLTGKPVDLPSSRESYPASRAIEISRGRVHVITSHGMFSLTDGLDNTFSRMDGIALATSIDPAEITANPCPPSNCSQLCVAVTNARAECLCEAGVAVPATDARNCPGGARLLYGHDGALYSRALSEGRARLVKANFDAARHTLRSSGDLLFWITSDRRYAYVGRVGEPDRLLVDSGEDGFLYAAAVELASRALLYTDARHNSVNATSYLPGNRRHFAVLVNARHPRLLVVLATLSLLAYTGDDRSGDRGAIYVCPLAGGDASSVCRRLVGVGGGQRIGALCADRRRVYWTVSGRLERADVDGSSRRTWTTWLPETAAGDLTRWSGSTYWTTAASILRARDADARPTAALALDRGDIDAFTISGRLRAPAHDATCRRLNCTYLCYADGDGRDPTATCSCPAGWARDDDAGGGGACVEACVAVCPRGGSSVCRSAAWRCDGVSQCDDAADEIGCATSAPPVHPPHRAATPASTRAADSGAVVAFLAIVGFVCCVALTASWLRRRKARDKTWLTGDRQRCPGRELQTIKQPMLSSAASSYSRAQSDDTYTNTPYASAPYANAPYVYSAYRLNASPAFTSSFYDRDHVTGASNSVQSSNPRVAPNVAATFSSEDSDARKPIRVHRRRHHHNRRTPLVVAHPTPCTTPCTTPYTTEFDDESDISYTLDESPPYPESSLLRYRADGDDTCSEAASFHLLPPPPSPIL